MFPLQDNAILQSILSKMNRDGKFEKNVFVLTSEELIYIKMPTVQPNGVAATAVAKLTGSSPATAVTNPSVTPEPARTMPLSTLLAL
jgi:hypothetical protein